MGGIGPEATAEFYGKLIGRLQKTGLIKSNRDFPQIVINSIPAPELIHGTISDEELLPYMGGLRDLDKFGVDFIVMVCNTIHLYYEKLQKEIRSPILDLRKELRNKLQKDGIKSALIIGTPNTIKQGLYRFKEIDCIEPDNEEVADLSNAIFDFNKGIDKEKQVVSVRKICDKYLSQGAETVILGCTEFAVMLGNENMPKINTIDVLVDAVVQRLSGASPIGNP